MYLYRVTYTDSGVSGGFGWCPSKAEAARLAATFRRLTPNEGEGPMEAEVERVHVPTRKQDLLAFLNKYAAHPDNG